MISNHEVRHILLINQTDIVANCLGKI